MKNLSKFLPVAALVLGLGLVMVESAFKSPQKGTEYGKTVVNGVVHWVDLSGLTYVDSENDLEEGQYTCDEQENEHCTAFFETAPEDDAIDPNNGQEGIFRQYMP